MVHVIKVLLSCRLKFTAGTSGSEVFVSCDMFYVEVLLEPDGRVRDVKVELAGDQSTHEGLVSCHYTNVVKEELICWFCERGFLVT